jgi:hypothetical protein
MMSWRGELVQEHYKADAIGGGERDKKGRR